MNKTKIEWTDYVWNPVRGCLHNCPYCYGKRIDRRFGDGSFAPTFYPERLQEPLNVKKPSRIFVGSMADLFGEWDWVVEDHGGLTIGVLRVLSEVFNIVNQCPQHTFIFLTKNPKGMQRLNFPDNCWCGTSVENQEKADARIPELLRVKCKTLFVSYEPALGPVNFQHSLNLCVNTACMYRGKAFCKVSCEHYPQRKNIDWLIIGAQTGPGAVKHNPDWISSAIQQARNANVRVFVKDNVMWPEVIREWPGMSR